MISKCTVYRCLKCSLKNVWKTKAEWQLTNQCLAHTQDMLERKLLQMKLIKRVYTAILRIELFSKRR